MGEPGLHTVLRSHRVYAEFLLPQHPSADEQFRWLENRQDPSEI